MPAIICDEACDRCEMAEWLSSLRSTEPDEEFEVLVEDLHATLETYPIL